MQKTHKRSLVRKRDKRIGQVLYFASSSFCKINDAALLNFDMNNNGVLFHYWPHQNQ